MATTRMTISIPKAIRDKMNELDRYVNWSAVATQAFVQEINRRLPLEPLLASEENKRRIQLKAQRLVLLLMNGAEKLLEQQLNDR